MRSRLEVTGRCLAGVAPWFECPRIDDAAERAARDELRALALTGLARLVDPDDADYGAFRHGRQAIVDAAFLAHGFLRAPSLWADSDEHTRRRLHTAWRQTRSLLPHRNNWLLFAALIETALAVTGAEDWDPMRIDYAVCQHEQWYLGDGVYGDGPAYRADHYNSYVIHPMLSEILEAIALIGAHWDDHRQRQRQRFRRYAAIQERLIAPDGTFPACGRSMVYRCGTFQALAMAALRDDVPPGTTRGGVRAALAAVIARTLDAAGSYDADGWLTIGLAGHQPSLGEVYICTASCYLASVAFLPLGLSADHPFWTEAPAPWTSRRLFERGEDLPADHAI